MNDERSRCWREVIRRDAAAFVVLATLSLGAGLVLNPFREAPLPLLHQPKRVRFEQEVARLMPPEMPRRPAAEAPSWREIGLEEFRAFVGARRGLVLDARPEVFHRLGHVPGAMSLPRDDFEKAYACARARLEAGKEKDLAVYCSDAQCEDGRMVAEALQRLGFRRLLLFKAGWAEWTRAGLPEER
jgi:rhodanese-related sulfurtransferase